MYWSYVTADYMFFLDILKARQAPLLMHISSQANSVCIILNT